MKAPVALVAAAALGALALSIAMFPRDKQVGLMTLKDHDFDTARTVYESRWNLGDRAASVAIPLTQIYLNFGDIDRAVAVMEELVAAQPSNPQAYRILADLYFDAQRFGDLRLILERMADRFPSDANLRELAAFYETYGMTDAEIAALARIVSESRPTAQELRRLAGLLAAAGERRRAADMLRRLDMEFPEEAGSYDRLTLLSLLLDESDGDGAYGLAAAWTRETGDGPKALTLAIEIADHGRPDLARRLLEPHAADGRTTPAIAHKLAELDIALGDRESARRRLLAALSPPPDAGDRPRLIGLALELGDFELAMRFADVPAAPANAAGELPGWAIAGLAGRALTEGRRDLADRLIARAPAGFQAEHPTFAARLALASEDRAGALVWAERALKRPDMPLQDRIDIADLFVRLDLRERAGRILDGLEADGFAADDREPPEGILDALSALYVALGRAEDGQMRLAALRARRPGPEADRAWARVAAAAGDADAVAAWFEGEPAVGPPFLEDVYYAASEAGSPALALVAATRLHALAPSPRAQRLLGEALVQAGRGADALPYLRPLLPGDAALEAVYLTALQSAGETGEVARILQARMADPALTEQQRTDLLYRLIDAGAHDAALPFLEARAWRQPDPWLHILLDAAERAGHGQRGVDVAAALLVAADTPAPARETAFYALVDAVGLPAMLPHLRWLADTHGGPWVGTYADALGRLGQRDTLLAWQRARAADPNVAVEARRQIADDLLADGRKEMAVEALVRVAEADPPDGPNARQLLYLWGPRPPPEGLDWLERRASEAASPPERSSWLAYLADAGAADRVIRIVEASGGPAADGSAVAYLRALADRSEHGKVAETVTMLAAQEHDPERLREYARVAERSRERDAAAAAWAALRRVLPSDPEALRQLGMLAYGRGRPEQAEGFLRLYLTQRPDDYEANYFYGLTLSALRRDSLAAGHFRRALGELRRASTKDRTTRMLEANLLGRLGQTGEALALFETLMDEMPADAGIRADYASLLLQNGMVDRARSLLDAR